MATAAQTILGAIQGLGYAADTPGALLRGALSGRPGSRASGRDLLQAWNLVGSDKPGLDVGDALGFATELVADPLNLLGGAGALRTALAGRKVIKANKASAAMRAAGYMPEEVAALTKFQDGGKPVRLLHGTAAPPFSQFAEDAGSGNWLGKGVYFSKDPGAADIYAVVDKSPLSARKSEYLTDWQSLAAQLPPEKQALAGSIIQQVAEGSAGIREFADNTMQELNRQFKPLTSDAQYATWLSRAKDLASAHKRGNRRVMMRYVDSRQPFKFESQATRKDVEALTSTMTPEQKSRAVGMLSRLKAADVGITKGRAWAIANSALGPQSGDRITDALRGAGYDAISHGESAFDDTIEKLRDMSDQLPDFNRNLRIDKHDEFVPFSPQQVYLPYIAPAMRPVPSARGQAASLALFNAMRGTRPQPGEGA